MDWTQGITAAAAIAALLLPVLVAVAALAQRVAMARPRVPSSRLGGIVVLCGSLRGIGRPAPATAAIAPITTRAIPVAPAPVPPAMASAAPSAGSYVVRPGDSLWAIACRHLEARGDTPTNAEVDRLWRAIWVANRAAIGDDPDLIYPGTHLSIPGEQA